MGAITEARAAVNAALATLSVPVFDNYTGAVQPPCVLVLAGSPYLDPSTTWDGMTVGLDVRIVVNDAAGADTGTVIDALIDEVVTALVAANGVQVLTVSAPTPEPDQGVLVVDVPTLTTWKDSA
jgi:hypothetical protein